MREFYDELPPRIERARERPVTGTQPIRAISAITPRFVICALVRRPLSHPQIDRVARCHKARWASSSADVKTIASPWPTSPCPLHSIGQRRTEHSRSLLHNSYLLL